MKKLIALTAVMCLATFVSASDKSDVQDRLQNSSKVLQEILAAPDKGIPEEVLTGAKCIAIVPHMIKGGLGFGGQHGKGVSTCRTTQGWSAPAFFTISGGSFGLQIGAEGVDLVMVMMNDKGMQALLSNKVEIGGDMSAAAGPVGRHAQAGTDWKLESPILTYSRAKGAFAGVTINGSAIRSDEDSTKAFYGKELTSKQLLAGTVPPPTEAREFLNTVARAQTVARGNK